MSVLSLTVCKVSFKHHNRYGIFHSTTEVSIVIYKQFDSKGNWDSHLPSYDTYDQANIPIPIPIKLSKEKISTVFEVNDASFDSKFVSRSGLYFALLKAFLDEHGLVFFAIILSLLYWHGI